MNLVISVPCTFSRSPARSLSPLHVLSIPRHALKHLHVAKTLLSRGHDMLSRGYLAGS